MSHKVYITNKQNTVKVPSGEAVGVSASWLFNGVYAGVELGELTVSGTVPAR